MYNMISQERKENIYQEKISLTTLEKKPKTAKMMIARQITVSMNKEMEELTNLMIKSIIGGFLDNGKK
ncbi:MAG: hypothetical protein ACLUTV_06655 [Dorea longicatena]